MEGEGEGGGSTFLHLRVRNQYENLDKQAAVARPVARPVWKKALAVFAVLVFALSAVVISYTVLHNPTNANDPTNANAEGTAPVTDDKSNGRADTVTEEESNGRSDRLSSGVGVGGTLPITCSLSSKNKKAITVGGTGSKRAYDLYIPPTLDISKGLPPLLVAWHGIASKPSDIEAKMLMKAKAEEEGWVVVYPYGTGFPKGFDGAGCCSETILGPAEDEIGLFKEIINELTNARCIDPLKVFSVGFSNGGFMTEKIGCESGDRPDGNPWVRGIGVHSGLIGEEYTCTPGHRVPMIAFHALNDEVVGFNGDGLSSTFDKLNWRSFMATMAIWKANNECTESEGIVSATPSTTCTTHDECGIKYCVVDGLGHNWSGQPDLRASRPNDLSATQVIIEFFKAQL